MKFLHAVHNGKLVSIEDIRLPVHSLEFSYGFGVYETLRVQEGHAYFLEEHLQRLLQSANIIELSHGHTVHSLKRWIQELIERTAEKVYNIKILLIGGATAQDAQLYIFPMAPLFPQRSWYTQGVSVITVPFERPFPKAKTLSMLPSYLAYKKARATECYDALAIHRDGTITEGTRTNFFTLIGKTIYMPPSTYILDGVTMMKMLESAQQNGFTVEETKIRLNDLPTYEGAFLTSTSSKILPIRCVNEFTYTTISPHIFTLQKIYDTVLLTDRNT